MKDFRNVSGKIKLVVFNEYCLGYILPEIPDEVMVLRDLITKGAPFSVFRTYFLIGKSDSIRLANVNDFKEYRVHFSNAYLNGDYEMENLNEILQPL